MAQRKIEQAITTIPTGGDLITLKLPHYAVRYLEQMCRRERAKLNNMADGGVAYAAVIDLALDAVGQIEQAIG